MFDTGADGYILKVRPLSVVREVIMTVMRGQKYIDSSITITERDEEKSSPDDGRTSRSEQAGDFKG
jgi:two-component system nitrate/nitrite response regulator NarL